MMVAQFSPTFAPQSNWEHPHEPIGDCVLEANFKTYTNFIQRKSRNISKTLIYAIYTDSA